MRALANEIGVGASEDDDVVCEKGTLVASIDDTSAPRRLGCLELTPTQGEKPAGGEPRGRTLDVVRWTAAHLGVDGAPEASKALCDALARQPGALASPSGEVRAEIRLVFPDNDVAAVVVRPQILAPQAGISTAEASSELERVLAPITEALRGIGGSASEATIVTRIRCRRTSSRPVVAPLEREEGQGRKSRPAEGRDNGSLAPLVPAPLRGPLRGSRGIPRWLAP